LKEVASKPLLMRVGWTTIGYAGTQVVRFGTNLVLTRLLAPELFGLMVLLTSLRVGLELLTDVGITQNVVANRNARDPDFYNTAWTLQLLRAAILCLVPLAFIPFADIVYPGINLAEILPYLSVMIIVMGAHSVGLHLATKELQTFRVAVYELSSSVAGSAVIILTVWLQRDIYGLLYGNILSIAIATVFTYWLVPGLRLRLTLVKAHVHEIVGFGKWIFISSVAFFLATNFDRLVLAKYVSLASLGLYGLARSLADIFGQLGSKLGNAIIFPSVAAMTLEGREVRHRIANHRLSFMALACAVTAALIAGAELIVGLLYDERYRGAASVLPVAAIAVWFGIINTLNENVLLGLRKAQYLASGNIAKFVALFAILPYAVSTFGIVGAAWATVASELCRYAILSFGEAQAGIGFKRQDVLLTAALAGLAVALHLLLLELGLVESWTGLHAFLSWGMGAIGAGSSH
jgi:O-antigen/teichoic acid export membrane protein